MHRTKHIDPHILILIYY
uniref:Uncharacterized protein n=1 Tax=Rhizophora mucronata TaxID=61149 RepID=A0A2P2QYT4_RHIMU